VTRAAAAQTLIAPYNDVASVESLIDQHRGDVAAIVVEPVAANMGVVPPAPGFLHGLRDLATRSGALLIFDEVITGFRVAHGGAQARYGVTPDVTVLGKIIGGGMPIGAYGGRADLLALVAPDGPVYQAGTLSGHPLAMAAGLATLTSLTPASYDELERLGAALETGLSSAANGAGATVSIARVGSIVTPFFAAAAPRDYEEAKRADTAAFTRFFHAMEASHIFMAPSAHEAWFLSLAHSDADIAAIAAAARGAFAV